TRRSLWDDTVTAKRDGKGGSAPYEQGRSDACHPRGKPKFMSVFAYRARTQEGKAIEGELEAATPEEAAKKLRSEGFLPTRIHQKTAEAARTMRQAHEWQRISAADMILFNSQLANLISAGVPLLSSLRTIAKVMPD